MASEIPGASAARIKEVSDFVGYPIDQFTPQMLPSTFWTKAAFYGFTTLTLAWPFVYLSLVDDEFWFATLGVVFFVINLVAGFRLDKLISDIHHEWANAVTGISNSSGQEASRSVHNAVFAFRRLITWDNTLGYETFLFHVLYVGIALLTIAELLEVDGAPRVFKALAPAALLYYASVNLVRAWVIFYVMRTYTRAERLDPSLQICAALAHIHKQFQNCSTKTN